MLVYRVSKSSYIRDVAGTGAKLYGGRWNHIDTPCVYASASRALAVLEYLVNIGKNFLPSDLSFAVFEIDKTDIFVVENEGLPFGWNQYPVSRTTKDVGTDLLQSGKSVIQVPSVVIEREHNFLLNPMGEKSRFRLVTVEPVSLDRRLNPNFRVE